MIVYPTPKTADSDLGIWGVSAFLGLAIGPLLWGVALETAGGQLLEGTDIKIYPYEGYVYMLIGGTLFCVLAGTVVRNIKKAN